MKALRVVSLLAVAGAIIFVGVALARRSDAAAYRLEREALRRELVERAVVARALPGPGGADEARALVSWWFEELAALRQRHPGSRELRPRGTAGADEWLAYADERVKALREAYAPLAGGVDQGLRLDVLAISPGEHPDTHERMLRIDFALWGPPRRLDPEGPRPAQERGPRQVMRVVVPVSFRQLALRFITTGGKAYGEMTGSGEPFRMLKDPERFSEELPAGVALGSWWVEPFPREAARVEILVGAVVQGTTAAALSPTFRIELPVVEAWQLRPGEAYRAEPRELAPGPAGGKP